ncbi:signal recognition particle-docking protein FtsY [Candidatus Pelagibacter sp.]|jgi:fused signal recognition particle receptor|uniref:signal recognition particle-docking protein FtsY n=1 Tax=uncultured Candidatus Pelagibacter sp. TaxID=372654 RepID=UPI00233B585D|nr:signal recognition particle-docking protein FtsY [uncultured Candidatus Pelagibacter sp.]MDB4811571.1 signal recognition particle-docking protein FtsY [Candidatus Pelagibacter sp.]MDC3216128.1 signal recognition particle-docking protein FtsY [bacterium]MDC0428446.1 signal recognition particle-docking protein FtsY [Candidatus Pelagibacter sp.]MDC0465741.1 signal recognition particle-docking protein FtsY [Candidatus Pelagibacter sp.]MDC1003277.1 signal recognition particle-docking protein Fts
MGIFDKFKSGFKKSASALTSGLRDIVVKKEIDDKTLDKIEEYLIQSDVGVIAASEIKEIISDSKIDPKKDIAEEISTILKEYIISLMKPLENESFFQKKEKINATLVSGVNGVGKTTTIGKISKILKANGNKVMLAASDTFRAAAIEQLENWANKVEVEITKSSQGADPASVAYKAIEEAIANNFNQVLIDTAGRLQNKKNLMEEYKKIANVTKKIDPKAPHDVILVLDATSGQNVINQVEEFNKIIPITGLIMTKLDGTAKGGILLAVAKKYKLPIIALGLGEKEDDLQIFEAEKFADAFTQIN